MLFVSCLFVSHQARASGGRLTDDGKIGTVTCVHINSPEPDEGLFPGSFHSLSETK